eukprot:5281816-Pleurochrysis_carterae.AAC.2
MESTTYGRAGARTAFWVGEITRDEEAAVGEAHTQKPSYFTLAFIYGSITLFAICVEKMLQINGTGVRVKPVTEADDLHVHWKGVFETITKGRQSLVHLPDSVTGCYSARCGCLPNALSQVHVWKPVHCSIACVMYRSY